MSNRLYINISDWHKDAKEHEVVIQDIKSMAGYILGGFSPRQVGQWTVALIQNKEAPPELMPSAKELLSNAVYSEVLLLVRTLRERLPYKTPGGNEREVNVRYMNHWGGRLVKVEDENNGEPGDGFASVDDRQHYLDNAVNRLHSMAIGHVRGALNEIVGSGGDVRGEWKVFKKKVDEVIGGLMEEPTLG